MEDWLFCLNPFFSKILFNVYDPAGMVIGACDVSSPPHWTRDKLMLYLAQNVLCSDRYADIGWWVKPRYSWSGMGTGVRRIKQKDGDVPENYIGVQDLTGRHMSVDLILDKGGFVDKAVWFVGPKDEEGRFTEFWRVHDYEIPEHFWKLIGEYTGALNIEIIGDKILEIHTRLAGQFLAWNRSNLPLSLIATIYPDEIRDDWTFELPKRKEPVVSWVYNVPETPPDLRSAEAPGLHFTNDDTLGGWKRLMYWNTEGIEERPEI